METNTVTQRVEEVPHLLEIMLEIEDLFDSMDMYVYKNWIDGEVVEGPTIRRYWVDLSLKYEYKKMPDPIGAKRLLKRGVQVKFTKVDQEISHPNDNSNTYNPSNPDNKDEEIETEQMWLVKLEIPRRLLTNLDSDSSDFYEDEIDIDEVEDAIDMGIDQETGIMEEK